MKDRTKTPDAALHRLWHGPALLLLLGIVGVSVRPAEAGRVTRYAQMAKRLKEDARASPFVRLSVVGRSVKKKNIYLVRVADAAQDQARALRVLVLCRQHGDEPASTEAALSLLGGIAHGHGPALQAASGVTLYLMPMVNPDGADADTRENGTPADLNRDWGAFTQPETRAVAWTVARIHPQVIVDAHNWDANDTYDANCMEVGRDLPPPLKEAEQQLQTEVVARLTALGFTVHPTSYGADANPRLAHRYFSRQGLVSCLVETHSGDPKNTADFLRRQSLYIALIRTIISFYGRGRTAERLHLERLEGQDAEMRQEAQLFRPVRVPSRRAALPPRRLPSLAVGFACLYGLALGLFRLGSARASSQDQRPRLKRSYYQVKSPKGGRTKRQGVSVSPPSCPPRLPRLQPAGRLMQPAGRLRSARHR